MSTLETALILAAATGTTVACMWGLFRLASPRQPRVQAVGPDPAELLRLRGQLEAPEWLVCDSTTCAHMTTPHRRQVAEYATCNFCGRPAFVPAPAAPKEG